MSSRGGTRVAALAVTVVAAAAMAATGCRVARDPVAPGLEPVYDKATGQLTLLRYDADHDGRAETFSYMNGTRVVRIEIDTDGDGQIDRWEHYGADGKLARVGFSRAHSGREDAWSYANPSGEITRIDLAPAEDGRVTRTEHYQHAVLVTAEEDSDRDGAIDRWESYERGRLTRLAFDAAHAGHPTSTLTYAADGSVRIESSPDH